MSKISVSVLSKSIHSAMANLSVVVRAIGLRLFPTGGSELRHIDGCLIRDINLVTCSKLNAHKELSVRKGEEQRRLHI